MDDPDLYEPPGDDAAVNGRAAPSFFRAWLAFFVVVTIAGGLVGGIVGAVMSAIFLAVKAEPPWLMLAIQVAAFVASIPISFLCYRWSVRTFLIRRWGGGIRGERGS